MWRVSSTGFKYHWVPEVGEPAACGIRSNWYSQRSDPPDAMVCKLCKEKRDGASGDGGSGSRRAGGPGPRPAAGDAKAEVPEQET